MNHYYNKNLRDYAHELRTQTISKAEKYLWKSLLKENKQGVKFKRQRPIHFYIVDFFSQEIGLIIEVDGNSHHFNGEYDAKRQQQLEDLGYVFLRFREGEVLNDLNDVAVKIAHAVQCLKK